MGWKSIKDHYRIDYIVHVTEKGICIGMGYPEDIITIHTNGELTTRKHYMRDEDFARYERELRADPETLRRLIETPDLFERSICVYTYKDGQILEMQAEECGFPYVTHEGLLMSGNEFSTDKQAVINWAKSSEASNIVGRKGLIEHFEKELENAHNGLIEAKKRMASLEAQYPSSRSKKDSAEEGAKP